MEIVSKLIQISHQDSQASLEWKGWEQFMKKLGIIGGMGPMATAYFLQLMVQMTDAKTDQQHIEMLIYHCPAIPDRTDFILGKSAQNPVPFMVELGRKMMKEGADYLAFPCITAHYFHQELEEKIGMPIIHVMKETAVYLKERGVKKVGIMATDATVQTGLFSQELKKYGISCIYPLECTQALVMDLIYQNVKAGKSVEVEKFQKVSEELQNQGAEIILLGCTELSMIKRDYPLEGRYLDVMEVLAKVCVEKCGRLKSEYKELITTEWK